MSIVDLLSEAIELDGRGDVLQALQLYREGIRRLTIQWMAEPDGFKKDMIGKKIAEFERRVANLSNEFETWPSNEEIEDQINVSDGSENAGNAERVDFEEIMAREQITDEEDRVAHVSETKPSRGEICEQIQIPDGGKNYSYNKVFGKYFDSTVSEVTIEEPYLKAIYQFHNLVAFCELLATNCPNLKLIHFITTGAPQNYKKQTSNDDSPQSNPKSLLNGQQRISAFQTLQNSLKSLGITIKYDINEHLHHRQVILSNGFVIKVCRGLHYLKPPSNYNSIGAFNQDFRECFLTNIDILFCPQFKK